MEPSPPVASIRRCLYRDLDRILPIYNHYVTHTLNSFDLDVKGIGSMQRLYNSVLDQDLPFLVVTTSNDQKPTPSKEDILGYGYAHCYRRQPAFGGTVEIVIYVDPSATGQSIGKKLLEVLIDMLKAVPPGPDRDQGIREVVAIVPVDEGRDAAPFFTKFGFEDRGTLKAVGWKMGRWVDMRILQRSLVQQPRTEEKAEQEQRKPDRRWWSSLFRRRRRL